MDKNNIKRTSLFISAITSLIGAPNIALAHPQECANTTAPTTFIGSAGIVCLETIKVTDSSGTQIYKAALQSLAPEQPNSFKLISAEPANRTAETNSSTYSPNSGELSLPTVDIPQQYGTERYSANLVYKPDKNLFELTTANIFINPDYIPNQTWKPYGMLNKNERRGVDLLGQSIPFAHLANIVYDFNNTLPSPWELVELHEKDSGMQA
ncbi:MAG: lipase, partial [Gammaproteobacteria bacterium]|nr:lipase [Gammaproteobacteria bacterium]